MEEIRTITINDKEYPQLLKKIPDAPEKLYIKGKISSQELCFGIVGTRRCSSYGKEVTLQIAGDLADEGLTIVSGLAPGIDTFAHLAAVERGKRTIAVLGTGLDEKSIYPQSNVNLARKIIESGGCLVSEYPPRTPGLKQNFPRRNRIISGLSQGILVVEAKEKSGSLITARNAFEQKRLVFAIPGPIFSSNSRGPHALFKKGGKLVGSAEDILGELNLGNRKKKEEPKGDSREENLVLHVLAKGALDIDKIIGETKLDPSSVNSILAILELKGKIRNLGGNIYILSR